MNKAQIFVSIFLPCVFFSMYSYGKTADGLNTNIYHMVRDNIAVIEGRMGAGTGFICNMNGKKYLVTNRHVIDQKSRVVASFQDGKQMRFSSKTVIEVATNRDLARIEVNTDKEGLKLSKVDPVPGDKVEFYGNTLGDGVVTITAGEVLAVGPDKVEIDAKIQQGNSGSPLVRLADGTVVGVTTQSKENKLDGDPSKVGTRFDPSVALTREFAIRFTAVKWRKTEYGKFLKKIAAQDDLHDFLVNILYPTFNLEQEFLLECVKPDVKFKYLPILNRWIDKLVKCDEAYKNAVDKIREMAYRNKELKIRERAYRDKELKGGVGSYGEKDFKVAEMRIKYRCQDRYRVRKEVLEQVLRYVKSTPLLEDDDDGMFRMDRDVRFDRAKTCGELDRILRVYTERYRMQLKGLDLPGIQ